MSGLAFGLAAVLAIGALALLLIAVFGSKRGPSIVAFTRIVAIIGLVGVGVTTIASAAVLIFGGPVEVLVPVVPYWPEYPNVTDVTPEHGEAVAAEINEVLVTASNLSLGVRLLLASGAIFEGLAGCAVILAVILLCNRLRAGVAFTPRLRRAGWLVAAILALGNTLGQFLNGFGSSLAGEETLRIDGFTSAAQEFTAATPWPEPTFAIYFEFGALFLALGILVVAELVTVGLTLTTQNQRLQADTDGLV
ncbi:hypothetical protein CQ017_13310 [Arthrobacter sp. MYb224]|uniref:hypothetical protein n=1 Tax=Micrococcaceae TaxID=1268 RepID=UPI000BB9487C|nr:MULTISPECIES: hypothetical protein [Micrococcaceae]PCC30631.1 hypothetical protein CIK76_01180 [Glutamicibacter sp. BW80]PQZ97728.1 hypothetical protein CQ017_13310 [Arthrobacter sp. MYb224]PRA04040.1 hypothetical protein CQ019_06720 [Arthrobacter sp. MYb229]PRB52048.1 hypothetical protein CQ013_09860 [Arthrobacter sp. MYb216]